MSAIAVKGCQRPVYGCQRLSETDVIPASALAVTGCQRLMQCFAGLMQLMCSSPAPAEYNNEG